CFHGAKIKKGPVYTPSLAKNITIIFLIFNEIDRMYQEFASCFLHTDQSSVRTVAMRVGSDHIALVFSHGFTRRREVVSKAGWRVFAEKVLHHKLCLGLAVIRGLLIGERQTYFAVEVPG